ncbi:transposase family protein [Cylindrospermopsis raciborskii]|uniref:transposase family protein n=1 Tax=Cylindrospermopsis raciborskii TaxID=77022 RepID=UPI003BF83FBE
MKEVIVDGTERPVQRPQNRERQKEYYSGKKKRHTCKQITVSTREKRVIILTKLFLIPGMSNFSWHYTVIYKKN